MSKKNPPKPPTKETVNIIHPPITTYLPIGTVTGSNPKLPTGALPPPPPPPKKTEK